MRAFDTVEDYVGNRDTSKSAEEFIQLVWDGGYAVISSSWEIFPHDECSSEDI